MKPVYLCGPINGRTTDDCTSWREQSKALLSPLDTLDPMRRDYRGREQEPGIAQVIVECDIADIRASGTLLVMFDKPSVGTAMEVRIAHAELALPVHVVNISDKPRKAEQTGLAHDNHLAGASIGISSADITLIVI